MMLRTLISAAVMSLLLPTFVGAQTSYPMLMSLEPVAAQVGQTSEHTLSSRYSMFGATQVLVAGEGVTGEIVTPMELGKDGKEPSLTNIKVKFTIAADALPGPRDFRIIGPTGPSTLGQIVITRDPVIAEQAKNNTPEEAQVVTLPATLCGTIEKNEDVDFYRFTVDAPKTLTIVCWGMRIEDRIHDLQTHLDPIITLRNAATGSTVAAADNDYAADPFLCHTFEAPGDYLLEVRDVRYQGNAFWKYALEISDRPFVSQVYPLGVAGATETPVKLIGENLPDGELVSLKLPEDMPPGIAVIELPMGTVKTNPVSVVVSDLPLVHETVEPNDTPESGQIVTIPCGISGRIETEADIDHYQFEAKKGDRLSVAVIARQQWSRLDSIVRILSKDGRPLIENDDSRQWGKRTTQDSALDDWTAPADGTYVIEIRDVHLRGGDPFVYYLSLEPARPTFELVIDTDKTWLTPGTFSVVFVRAVRKNKFEGAIDLHVDNLPPGVTAHCGRILPGKGIDGCIVLETAADAAPAATNLVITGTASAEHNGETLELKATAQPMQEIYMPGGGRSHFVVDMHTAAIGQPADLRGVRLSTTEVTLKPGESVKIDVEIDRAEGFDKNVTLDMLFQHLGGVFANTLPEGVTVDAKQSQTLLTGKAVKGSITLTAAKTAPATEKQLGCIMANIAINFVMKATYSSPPLWVTVAP